MALRAVPEHPKFVALMSILGLSKLEAMGALELLWHFAGKYTPQGNIGKFKDLEVEAWIGWRGERGKLIAAFLEAGWLDRCAQHRLLIHDWHEHADTTTRKMLGRKNLPFLTDGRALPSTLPQLSDTCPGHVQDVSDLNGKTPSPPVPEPVPVPEPAPEPEPEERPAASPPLPPEKPADQVVSIDSGRKPEEAAKALKRGKTAKTDEPMPPLPDGVDPERWQDFVTMRNNVLRKPIRPSTAKYCFRDLERLSKLGHDPNLLLEKAVRNENQGFFGDSSTLAPSKPKVYRPMTQEEIAAEWQKEFGTHG